MAPGAVGADIRQNASQLGPWMAFIAGFGEVLPDPNNRFYLSPDKTDKWGLPQVVFDADFSANDRAMRFHELAGFKREMSSAKTVPMGPVKVEEIRLKQPL